MGMDGYRIEIAKLSDADGGGLTAMVPDLPGCRSDGTTYEEALANGRDSITCWLEAAAEMGMTSPAPSGWR